MGLRGGLDTALGHSGELNFLSGPISARAENGDTARDGLYQDYIAGPVGREAENESIRGQGRNERSYVWKHDPCSSGGFLDCTAGSF